MASTDKDTIRIISFDGSADSWADWEVKFLARAQRKEFSGILKGTVVAPPAARVLVDTVAADVILKKSRDSNNYAYEELLLSITTNTDEGRVAFHIVTGSKNTNLPEGDAALAWKRLHDKYAPKLAPKKLELRRAFQISKLKNSDQDPETWITYLEGLRMKLNLNNLTDDYEVQLSKLEEKLGSTTTVLTIDDVRAELRLRYARMTAKKNTKQLEDAESEKALAAFNKFKGTCTFCGKIGHKATACFSRLKEEKNGEEKKPKPKQRTEEREALYRENKCFHCKKTGHKIADRNRLTQPQKRIAHSWEYSRMRQRT